MTSPSGHLKVTQVKSSIGTKPKHRGTLRALGLRGIGRTNVLVDGPVARAMVARVPHLVEVVPATPEEVDQDNAARTSSGRAGRSAKRKDQS